MLFIFSKLFYIELTLIINYIAMKSRIIIFLCALMMCLTTNTLVANPTPQPVVGQPTMLFIAKDGQVSKKEARKQAEKERIKGYRVTKSMRWHSVIGIAVCAISILLLYKQAKKRKLLTNFIIIYALLLIIFVNNLFCFNVLRYVYPASFYLALVYPVFYSNKKFIIGLWRIFCGFCFLLLTISALKLVDYGLIRMVIFFSLNVGLYFLLSTPTSRCPHCNYYAKHELIKREYVGEEDVVEDEVHDASYETTHYEGKTKVITKHIAERHDYVKYNYKYYIDTYQCLHCNETFTKHRSDKTKIGTV